MPANKSISKSTDLNNNYLQEKLCFLSKKFKSDMSRREQLKRIFVLPNLSTESPGYYLPENEPPPCSAQFLSLSRERFQVPEMLFSPHEIGINSLGLSEAIVEAIMRTEELQRPILFKNIMGKGQKTVVILKIIATLEIP